MNDVQTQLNRLVTNFVDEVTTLAREAAVELLSAGLGPRRGSSLSGRGRGKGIKRTSGDLAKIGDELVTYVSANPGLRIEQINKALGTVTRDLQLPIRKLIAEGALKTKGQKRSTLYFPGDMKARGGRKKKD